MLIVSYQLFTETAVLTILSSISILIEPEIGTWLTSHSETIIFIHAFAWVFLLASVIPSTILGDARSIFVQFLFCLAISLLPIWMRSILPLISGNQIVDLVLFISSLFNEPVLATLFLLIPYILMISIDIRSRRQEQRIERMVRRLETNYAKRI